MARFARGTTLAVLCAAVMMLTLVPPAQAEKPAARLQRAAVVFHEIMSAPDGGIPRGLLHRAQCVIVIPGMKRAGLGLGGNFGRGVVSCRTGRGWSAPLFLTVGGGSFGLQIGAQESDLVMLIMNQEGAHYLLKDKFALGGDMEATAGPVGRSADAQTDALMHAEMLAYSRSRGLFGGITLKGGVIKQDHSANKTFYGSETAQQILSGRVGAPPEAGDLLAALRDYSRE
ncbi:MAG TPA: lipid-binding SYLF domain-containing protein [Terriglobales bacterium]|nr:lipid-binding SYLF domain-containing protein [Terriglobales bacterium]